MGSVAGPCFFVFYSGDLVQGDRLLATHRALLTDVLRGSPTPFVLTVRTCSCSSTYLSGHYQR